jgi:sucrose-6-phosphate hydrolase SacC (GH32 family)
VVVVYVELPPQQHSIHFFTSPNLRDWTLASITRGGVGNDRFLYECPDFFELPIDGDPHHKKWVLMAANSEYAVGRFDGATFTAETEKLPGQRGRGFYAPQTFSDLPATDGRRIQIGWFQTATPEMAFNQSMTIPMELRLAATADGPRLTHTPVRELEALRGKRRSANGIALAAGAANPLAGISAELLEVRADFEPGDDAQVTFEIRGATLLYDARRQELTVNGHRAPAPLRGREQQLTIYCDRTGLEVFASDGLTYVPMPFTAQPADRQAKVSVVGNGAKFRRLEAYELKSAWPHR